MKLSQLTTNSVLSYIRADETAENTAYITDIALPAAKSYITSYTGRTLGDLDQYEDVTIAAMAICADMFDVRAYTMTGIQVNPTVAQILGSHCTNFF